MKYTFYIVLILISTNVLAQQNLHDFKIPAIDGSEIDFSKYAGKKVLIVNTASECGYTPQYKELQELWQKYGEKLVVVGFPANNFGGQEPGNNVQIEAFCSKNYGVTFPLAAKVSVKGKDIHPMFAWVIQVDNIDFKGEIRWNFEKFLFDEQGRLIRRFRSGTSPLDDQLTGEI